MPITANNFYWSSDSPSEFDPLESSLLETGVKASLFNGAIKTSLSIYQIKQENILIQVEDKNSPTGYKYTQRGKDVSSGFECDFSGYILPSLQLSASYSYINAIIEDDADEKFNRKAKRSYPKT